jgi:hypothetical protein
MKTKNGQVNVTFYYIEVWIWENKYGVGIWGRNHKTLIF